MKKFVIAGALALSAFTIASAASADTVAHNSTPSDTWFYGTGNGYAPANTEVLTTDAGDQLFLRVHNTFQAAPASVNGVYSFATGAQQLSYDWGFDDNNGAFTGTATLSFTNSAGGSFSYNALFAGNDNAVNLGGSTENSNRFNFLAPLGFNPLVDSDVTTHLTVTGLAGGTKDLSVIARIGAGAAAVPEPASWALMLVGFGGLGVALRRHRRSSGALAA